MKNFFLHKKTVIICATLVLIASALDWGAFKAKHTLSQAGIQDPTPAMLVEKITAGDTATSLLIIRAGTLNQESPADLKETFLLSLREENIPVVAALLPKCKKLSAEDRADCLRTSLVDRHFKSSQWLAENEFSKEILMRNELSPVDWSINGGDEETSQHLLQLGFPLTASKGKKSSLERALSASSSPQLVSALIQSGADQNSFNSANEPLLHQALKNSSPQVVRAMITPETNLNIADALEIPALQQAVKTQEVAKVQALTEAGADLSFINPQGGNYLDTAVRAGDSAEIVSHFVSLQQDSEARNAEGLNALEQACWLGRPMAGTALIQSGATVAEDFFSTNYQAGNQAPLSTMFATGLSSPDAVLPNGDTLLIDCVVSKRYDMIAFLLQEKASPDLAGADLEPALAYAVAVKDHQAAELLLTNGAKAQFTFQDTVAPRVLEMIDTDGVIKWFMDKDSRVTPIMVACDQGNLEMCQLLMQYGAENSSTKKHRFWPGNFAARRSYTDVVQFMLGAEPGNRDRTVTVDLSSQRATVYNKDKKTVMSFRISSGKKGNATKKGEFVVTNKKKNHVSTIYDVAMPYFQRLSYGDFGFHTGYVPGYPASHGCIRCPSSYAKKLYYHLKVGDVVTIQQ